MHKSKSLFNCSGAGTGEPGAVKAASPGSGRDGQKRSAHTEPRWPSTLQHPGKGMYPGAQGNGRAIVKRFWTDCLYSHLRKGYEQAGWMKEEPLSIYGGECQKDTYLVKHTRPSSKTQP